MQTVEEEALAMVNEYRRKADFDEFPNATTALIQYGPCFYALCWQIEAKRTLQATLDEREKDFREAAAKTLDLLDYHFDIEPGCVAVQPLSPFIQTPTDPLVEQVCEIIRDFDDLGHERSMALAGEIARGLAIVSKEPARSYKMPENAVLPTINEAIVSKEKS